MKGYDKLDPAKVRAQTLKYVADMRLKAQVHNLVCEVLKTFEGKVVNKRMATAVEKALEQQMDPALNLSAMWRVDFSWNSIKVWGGPDTLPYTGGYDQMINYHNDKGRDGDGRFHYDYWLEKYGNKYGHGKLLDYATEAESALRLLDQKVAAYNDAVDAVEKAKEALSGLATWS